MMLKKIFINKPICGKKKGIYGKRKIREFKQK